MRKNRLICFGSKGSKNGVICANLSKFLLKSSKTFRKKGFGVTLFKIKFGHHVFEVS